VIRPTKHDDAAQSRKRELAAARQRRYIQRRRVRWAAEAMAARGFKLL